MISYNIKIPNPSSHFIDIKIVFDKIKQPVLSLFLPAWRPGRYELGNFSKNVRHWHVTDRKGNALPFKKTTKDCWKIETGQCKEIIVSYQYFANILNAGACWLDDSQLYINGIHCFMYDKDRLNEPCELQLTLPPSWRIACGLAAKSKHTLLAHDFHQLVDCPLIASNSLQHLKYEVNKIPFHIWFQGECKPDSERILSDFKRFTEEQLSMFGSFPVKDYHFLIQVLPYSYYHGVEHTNSTVLALGPGYDLMKKEIYNELLGVACHELFHTWNIKTIRPKDMLPYDYQAENYSRLGYIYEGVTTYYGDYLLGRCGLFTDEEFLIEMSKRLQNHMDNAGRNNYSVAESSFDTWLDGYVPGIPGRKTSIYDEGCLLAMMLDLMIRRDSNGKKSLDDFMKLMNTRFGLLKKGYTETDLLKMIRDVIGLDYQSFFDSYINTASSLETELNSLLNLTGCEVIHIENPCYHENNFGFKVVQAASVTRVSLIYPGSIADQSGLFADDELISINGFKIENNLDAWCKYFGNEPLNIMVFSNKMKKEISMKISLETNPTKASKTSSKPKVSYFKKYHIRQMQKTNRDQNFFFEKWMGR